MKQYVEFTKREVEIMYAFKDMGEKFIIEDDKLYAIVDGIPIELNDINKIPLQLSF